MKVGQRKLDRIERESEEFFEAVRQGYLNLASENTERIALIDASESQEAVFQKILHCLAKFPQIEAKN